MANINELRASLTGAQSRLDKLKKQREGVGISVPVDNLGNDTQIKLPDPVVPEAPQVLDLPVVNRVEDARGEVTAAQKRILELSGEVGQRETFKQDLFKEQGLGDAQQQLTDIGSTLNLLKTQRDQLDIEANQIPSIVMEQFKGTGATKGGARANQSALQRENFLKQSNIASQQLLEQAKQQNLQGNINTSLDLIDQATTAKFAPIEAALLAEKDQYDFALANFEQIFTEEETKRLEALSAKKDAEIRALDTQKVFESDKNELQLIASKNFAPASVQRAIANATTLSEAMIAAGPWLSDEGADEIKASINQRRNISGTEQFDTSKLPTNPQSQVIAEYITDVFPEYPDIALSVAMAETAGTLDPKIQSGFKYTKDNEALGIKAGEQEKSFGIFQIHVPSHKERIAGRDLTDWKTNIDIAREIFDEAGGSFKPWSAFNNGGYKQFLSSTPIQSQFDEQLAKQPALYGIPTRLVDSDKDRERFEALVDSAFADGGSTKDVILKVQKGMLGFQINEGKEEEAAALLPFLQSLSDVDSADYQNTARLINSGQTEKAVTRIENQLFDDTDKNYKKRQTLAQESARKIKDIESLLAEVPTSDLGRFDSVKLTFKKRAFQGALDQNTVRLQSKLVALFQAYRLENLGSAVTETELKTIEDLIATTKDDPKSIRTKLQEFEIAMRDSLNAARETSNLPLTNAAVLRGEIPKSSLYLGNVSQGTSDGLSDEDAYNLYLQTQQ